MGNVAAVEVLGDGAVVVMSRLQVLGVVVDSQREFIGYQVPLDHLEAEHVSHLLDDDPALLEGIGAGKDDAGVEAVVIGVIVLDIVDGGGLVPPGVVNQ